MTEVEQSYWEQILYEQSFDLIVVGAGITGLSASYFFKQAYPDAKVLVVDRGIFPIGASTRNAGFACIGSVAEHLADLEIESEEKLRNRIRQRYKGLLLLREVLGEEHIGYEDSGGCELFADRNEFVTAREQIPRFNKWMEELMGEDEVYRSGTYLGHPCIYNRLEGMLHPGKLIKRLYQLNVNAGVEIRWQSEVSKLDTGQNQIELAQGLNLQADRMIIATNAFTKTLLPNKEIKPGRGYVFVTNELALMEWKGTFHYNKGYVYFRNVGEQRILIGGGRNIDLEQETTDQFGVNSSVKEYLINFANELLELPEGWQIEQEWSGIMGFTKSKSPIFERIGKNCLVAAGLSGMGVALGMQLGKKASEDI